MLEDLIGPTYGPKWLAVNNMMLDCTFNTKVESTIESLTLKHCLYGIQYKFHTYQNCKLLLNCPQAADKL